MEETNKRIEIMDKQEQIARLEKAIASQSTPENMKEGMRARLTELQAPEPPPPAPRKPRPAPKPKAVEPPPLPPKPTWKEPDEEEGNRISGQYTARRGKRKRALTED